MITLSHDKLTEINKSTYEFERDIIRGGMNPVSMRTCTCSCIHTMVGSRSIYTVLFTKPCVVRCPDDARRGSL